MAIEQLQKLYPKWIPYPGSWLKALLAIAVVGPVGTVLATSGLWASLLAVFAGSVGAIQLSGVYAGLAIGAAILLVPTVILAYVYHILTLIFDADSLSKKHPHQFPTWLSWRQGLLGVLIVGVSISIVCAVVIWYHPYFFPDRDFVYLYDAYGKQGWYPIFRRSLLTDDDLDEILTVFAAIWLTSAAYLYQWDYVVQQKRQRLKKHKKALAENSDRAKQPAKPQVDPVNVELNRLRTDMGLHRIKTYPSKRSEKSSNK